MPRNSKRKFTEPPTEVHVEDDLDVNIGDAVMSIGNVDTVSPDGRRIIRQTLAVSTPAVPIPAPVINDSMDDQGMSGDGFYEPYEGNVVQIEASHLHSRRRKELLITAVSHVS